VACGCSGSTARSSGQQQQASAGSGSAYQWEATYNDGGTQRFNTEQEAQSALAYKGGGYRMVPR
jgi:hypothetical protein